MKKAWFFLVFAAVLPFAANAQERSIYVEGTAPREDQYAFFMEHFKMDAVAVGYTAAESKSNAVFTFHFDVVSNIIMYDDGTEEQAPPDENQYFIQITFIRNEDDTLLISFDFPFTELDEMYEFNQYLFIRAVSSVSLGAESGAYVQDTGWQNKWLYVRLSLDYPIITYGLRGDGLIAGKGVYAGETSEPSRVSPLENKTIALPGLTLGVEVIQFFSWMTIEPNFQLIWENLNDEDFINLTVGIEVKFPLKFKFSRNLMLDPYAAVSYPIPLPASKEIFDSFPLIAFGGGVQIGIRGGRAGAAFMDFNFMYYGDVGMNNPYGELFPNPSVIHYQRTVIGIRAGYKLGFFDRKSK